MIRLIVATAMAFGLHANAFGGLDEGLAAFTAKDYASAQKELQPLAERGDPAAQHHIGMIHEFGLGVSKDMKLALPWYMKAAEQGYARSQLNLGAAYSAGNGVVQDDVQAVTWWRKAAEQGNATAAHNLAIMYSRGRGVPQDFKQAVEWYRKAVQGSYAKSVYNLGMIYANGAPGVPKDPMMAYVIFSLAVPEDGASQNYKGIVGAQLSTEQLTKAREILAALKEGGPLP